MTAASLTAALADAISMAQAARLYGVHVTSAWRHATRGIRGVKLQTWMRGGQRVTTFAAVEAFLHALNEESEPAVNPVDDFTRRAKAENAALKAALGCATITADDGLAVHP